MFSQTVEYALRAVVHLADQSPAARTTDQIAAAIPAGARGGRDPDRSERRTTVSESVGPQNQRRVRRTAGVTPARGLSGGEPTAARRRAVGRDPRAEATLM